MKRLFLAWIRYDRRSDLMAQHLGAPVHFVVSGDRGRSSDAPRRYAAQAVETWRLLLRERPDLVFVQNPPIVAVLIAAIYARRFRARFVIDSHSGAFLSAKWRWSIGIHRWLSRQALITIVPNEYLAGIVRSWGCRVTSLGFTPGAYPPGEPFPLNGHFNVAVISAFSEDEPIDVVFDAARRLPGVHFYITGDARRLAGPVLAKKPDNCCLTGYLSYERYIGLLRGVHTILDLTTQDNTLLMGAYEAVSLGVPLIISDWPILRDYFSAGAVHVPNTVEGIVGGVSRVQRDLPLLQREIGKLHEQLQLEWNHKFAELQSTLTEYADVS